MSNLADNSDALRDLLLEESDEGDDTLSDLYGSDDSDLDPNYVLEEESDYSDEVSADDNDGRDEEEEASGSSAISDRQRNVHTVHGRSKKFPYAWSTKEPERRGRLPQRNLVLHLPGPKGAAKRVSTAYESWNILLDDIIIEEITLRTNDEIARQVQNIKKQSYHCNTSKNEILSFIGLLYLSGVHRDSRRNLEELWSVELGFSIYRATMSLPRFRFLCICLRFDDKTTRQERLVNDRLAAIRFIWDRFIGHCKEYYTPHEYCTIDEQLLGFRGRCSFRVYIKSKPDRYGLKVLMMNDSKTSYMVNAIPYIGVVKTNNKEPVPTYYVRKLSEPIHGTNRNLTTDNWFTSVPLLNLMLTDYQLTMVGTLRANKTEIPASFLATKPAGQSLFAFDHNKTLVSYSPKEKKNVLLLSTLHRTAMVDEATNKPEVVLFYNSTKSGTDTFDQLCHSYTVCRKTNRWPLRYFYGILDQAGINSMILYNMNVQNPKLKRRAYLKTLALSLIRPFLHDRLQIASLQRGLKLAIREILHIPDRQEEHGEPGPARKQRCSFCPRSKDRKTKLQCSLCHAAMCDEHRGVICKECSK